MKTLLRIVFAALCFSVIASSALADGGVLVPYVNGRLAHEGALTLVDMEVRVKIDNGMAHVAVLQIYKSHSKSVLEGEYEFVLPELGELSGFAIWEEGVRIPGIILERWKAKDIYENFKAQSIDPGIVETEDETQVNRFTCKVFPIPPYGTKRLELFYTQRLPIESKSEFFVFPAKPEYGKVQKADRFRFDLEYVSQGPIGKAEFSGDHLTPEITESEKGGFTALLDLTDVKIDENVTLTVPVPFEKSEVYVVTHRDVERVHRDVSPFGGKHYKDETGFFGARVLLGVEDEKKDLGPKQVIVAMDTSLSMQWDKLQRASQTAFAVLSGLNKGDKFSVVTFDATTKTMSDQVLDWSEEAADNARQWILSGTISGGTDFKEFFDKVAAPFKGDERKCVVLLTDGGATESEIDIVSLIRTYKNSKLARSKARLFVVAIGDSVNRSFLTDLATQGQGPFMQMLSTEDSDHKTGILLERLDSAAISKLKLSFKGLAPKDMYPKEPGILFGGQSADFFGRYDKPGKGEVLVSYVVGDSKKTLTAPVEFSEKEQDHEGLRRQWAKARVDELLEMIEREGEKDEWVKEIIDLARQFTFVTPYTSFLAAPRALLRPRVIRPGDPILRVKTDPSIKRVVASFPFGLTEKMIYLPDQDIWQLRFLAPPGTSDGSYECRLFLTDVEGRRYIESKRFVIDGRPPRIFPKTQGPLVAGRTVEIVAAADADTRKLSAHLPYAGYCDLRYDPERKVSVGRLEIPPNMPTGKYRLSWYAEDFAHNVTRFAGEMEVVGHE